MSRTIQAIVTDVDQTLLTSEHKLSPRNERALRQAMAQGITVILATGKSRPSAEAVIRQLALDTPGVYLQGLAIYNADGTIRHERTLDPAVAAQVIALTEDDGHTVIAYCRDRIFMGRPRERWHQMLVNYHEPTPEPVESLAEHLNGTAVNKMVVFCEQEVIGALRERLEAHLGDSATLVQAVNNMLEIVPPGSSKGRGLKRLLDDLGIPAEHVLAIGDGENDVEMLQLAGIGAAVGNAADVAKAAADVVVATNDEDGVAEAIERFALNGR